MIHFILEKARTRGAKDKQPRKRKGEFRYTNVESGVKVEFITPKGTLIQFDKKYSNMKEAEEASSRYLKWRESSKAFIKAIPEGSIYVDFDKTLAYHKTEWGASKLGHPIPKMVSRVKKWLSQGKNIKIFTARATEKGQKEKIQDWLEKNGLPRLEVTNVKKPDLIEMWDDRARQVEPNTGEIK